MPTPFVERLGLTEPAFPSVEGCSERGLMARALMYLFAAGGAIMAGSLLLSPEGTDQLRIAITAAAAFGLALGLFLAYDRLPLWGFQVFLAAGTALIEWAIYASGETTSPFAMFYFWIAIYAFYFLSRARALIQMGFIALAYSVALFVKSDIGNVPVMHWAIVTCTLVVAGALIGVQRSHVDKLIGRLSDAARTDSLTSLLNRRGFEELFETELERARRGGRPLSVIVGDLDAFKAVNDRFGHAAGDRALERLSEILQSVKRRIDTAARIGGEEFAVIAPDTDQHAAYILAERMRREVRDMFASEPFPLTISLGIATFPRHGATAESLIGGADEALYAAKKLGRDRTVVYNPELADTLLAATGSPTPRSERHSNTVLALAEVIDIRDSGTAAHSETVGHYAGAIARELGLSADLVERVRFGGIVHDVGKIGIPDSVLRKPGWLTDDDWNEMHRHPEIGARILRGANLDDISEWVLAHHERPDGRGYPHGLSGHEIPLEARILAVADAYEAMTSDRVYRPALTPEVAREELQRCAGTQFDSRVVDAFVGVLGREDSAREVRVAS
ncbi:MAG TPA: diguanylate cyclase [Thermoleophilaceae bacterium]|jgi:diguanylate cyclase (GGDEF)-like protein/putative nucleotidyltransferase with HDIG domain